MGFKDKATAGNVNEQDEQGNTIFHEVIGLASPEERLEVVRKLMALGADPNIANNEGITAMAMVGETLKNIKRAVEVSREDLETSIKNSAKTYTSMPSDYAEEIKEENKKEGREDLTAARLRQERIEDYNAEIEAGSASKKDKIKLQRQWEKIEATIAAPNMSTLVKVSLEEKKPGRPTLEQANISGDQHVQKADGNVKATPGGSSPKSVANKEIY
jgi:hypothetical protein